MGERDSFEYIRIELDMGDLTELNRFSVDGWRVVAIIPYVTTGRVRSSGDYALLERRRP